MDQPKPRELVRIARSGAGRPGYVTVSGAREHNLRDVDVELPRDALVVFTGVSGSGKSSLAFGTLYAEAQRRYFESVAPYARRMIDQVGVPDVDAIEGLPPAVALQQQRGSPSARSSVGSVTTLSSLVRMMYSRAGTYPPGQPMLYAEDFSPNTPQGACPSCGGLGRVYHATEASMVPDPSLTIRERAVAAWPQAWGGQNLRDILVSRGVDVDTPWKDLPRALRDWILFTDDQPQEPVYAGLSPEQTRLARKRRMEPSYRGTFTGARRYVLGTFTKSQSALMRRRAARYLVGEDCPACHGKRLKPQALSVTFAGLDIGDLSRMPLSDLAETMRPAAEDRLPDDDTAGNADPGTLDREAGRRDRARRAASGESAHAGAPDVRATPNLSIEKRLAAQRLAADLVDRIGTLMELGLGYLSLDRVTTTLSSGELQRLRLATQLRSQLFGVAYVLDEPTAGLHPADGDAMHDALAGLLAAGNSLFVVEHDIGTMRRADWLVDVGPAAGEHGGTVLYSGPPEGLRAVEASRTRLHLFGLAAPPQRPGREASEWLHLEGIVRNNLRGVSASFPLACLTAVTGISGSGKSSLVSQALLELVGDRLGRPVGTDDEPEDPLDDAPGPTEGRIVGGMRGIRRLVKVDQKPIGRTPRSNLATYTGLFNAVRKLFAATPEARRRRYDAGRFSFNVANGRCPAWRARVSSASNSCSCRASTPLAQPATAPATRRRRWRSPGMG
ncbi:UvrABC system protein A [Methylobacterium iners]|uniref:UvrABC system protein A n=1 Tax=Methylobacterium iners TaxID=418707 RepID=A0ABQ4RZ22_9HYPH|nr:UvrABC system protein A [Methylobacterium iners]